MKTGTMTKRIYTSNHRRQRRGITLLFVVSMIVLFLLMAVTYMIVAYAYRQASKPRAARNIYRVDDRALVQQALYELIR